MNIIIDFYLVWESEHWSMSQIMINKLTWRKIKGLFFYSLLHLFTKTNQIQKIVWFWLHNIYLPPFLIYFRRAERKHINPIWEGGVFNTSFALRPSKLLQMTPNFVSFPISIWPIWKAKKIGFFTVIFFV